MYAKGDIMKKLIIVGAGGAGREIYQIAHDCESEGNIDWKITGFIDDNINALGDFEYYSSIKGTIRDWKPQSDEVFICAIGNPKIKEPVIKTLLKRGASFINIIHPTAIIAPTAKIGMGVVIYPYTIVSVDAVLEDYVTVLMHSSVGHDTKVGAYTTLSSYCDIMEGVTLGKGVFFGSHACAIPSMVIGDGAYAGAGSVIMTRVGTDVRVMGNPAKKIPVPIVEE